MTSEWLQGVDPRDREAVKDLTGLDPIATIRFFDALYLEPLSRHLDLTSSDLLDCACGSAWLAMAARLRGARRVVAADLFPNVLEKAEAVARLLGLDSEIEFVLADVTHLPFAEKEFDVVCSIETLEHVPVEAASKELARVCRTYFVVETINRKFPIDTHDTPYPLAHFLPTGLRRRVNAFYGTTEVNRYPSWREVEGSLSDFSLVTPFKTFDDPDDWQRVFPLENPYVQGKLLDMSQPKWRMKRWYYRGIYAIFGIHGRYFMDKIIGIYVRKNPVLEHM